MKSRIVVPLLIVCVLLTLPVLANGTSEIDKSRLGIGVKIMGQTPLLNISLTREKIGTDLTLGLWSFYGASLLWLNADVKAYASLSPGGPLRPYIGGGICGLIAAFGGAAASIVGFDLVGGMDFSLSTFGFPITLWAAAGYWFFPSLSIAGGLYPQFGVRVEF